MILGIDEHELAPPDAATGSGGSGGAATTGGGQGGNAGQSGAAGQGATAGQSGAAGQGAAAGAGGNPPDDASAGRGGSAGQGGTAGQDGSAGQGGNAGQSGDAGQGGTFNRDAGDEGVAGSVNRDSSIGGGDADAAPPPSDANTADVPSDASCSNPGTTECRGGSVFLCIGGVWVETQKCPYACIVNVCGGVCVPNSIQCTGNTPQRCDDTGTWVNGAMCPYLCSQGACTGMCVPGTTVPCGDYATCNDGAVQTCDFAGTLGACNPAPSNCEIIPAGWQPVAKPASGNCPSGFGSPQTIYTSASGAPYTCSCGCSGTQACEGNVTVKESTGCAGTVSSSQYIPVSFACLNSGFGQINSGYGYTLSDINFGPYPACYASPTPTTQPPAQTTTATLCYPNLTCTSGACLSASQTANLCVTKYGMDACPPGYPNGTTYSPWYDDTRTCGSCTCGTALSCTITGVQLNNRNDCVPMGPYWMTATTSCSTAPSDYPLNSVKAEGTSAGDPSCVEKSPSLPMGTVELNQGAISTVCCK